MKHYRKGEQVKDIGEISGEEFIYFRHKIYHRGWFESWQYRWLRLQVQQGNIWKAVKIKGVVE